MFRPLEHNDAVQGGRRPLRRMLFALSRRRRPKRDKFGHQLDPQQEDAQICGLVADGIQNRHQQFDTGCCPRGRSGADHEIRLHARQHDGSQRGLVEFEREVPRHAGKESIRSLVPTRRPPGLGILRSSRRSPGARTGVRHNEHWRMKASKALEGGHQILS